MREKHIFDKESAIKEMKEESRGIITPEYASDLIAPFTTFAKIPMIKGSEKVEKIGKYTMDLGKRITWFGEKREGVGVSELTQKIVELLGEQPYTESPYLGTGRTAEHLTKNNLAILCAKLGIESDDCKEIFAWIGLNDFEELKKKFNPKITKEEYDKLKKVV